MKTLRLMTAILLSISIWATVNTLCIAQIAYGQEVKSFSLCQSYRTNENYNFCDAQPHASGCVGHCSTYVTTGRGCASSLNPLDTCPPIPGTATIKGKYTNPDDNSCI